MFWTSFDHSLVLKAPQYSSLVLAAHLVLKKLFTAETGHYRHFKFQWEPVYGTLATKITYAMCEYAP